MSAVHDYEFERFAIGQPVPRGEDPVLLRGEGRYTDDIALEGAAQGHVLRSPYAHGRIARLDTGAALAQPGVIAVLTAADLDAQGIGTMPCMIADRLKGRGDTPLKVPPYPPLAKETVRYLGQPVAFVVAETLGQARDAAEAIVLEIDELPAVTDPRAALAAGAPQLHDAVPNNMAIDWEFGDAAAVEAAFARAHHVTRLKIRNSRLVVSAMEPRACVAEYDTQTGHYTLTTPSQGVFGFTNILANRILNVPRDTVHVRTPNVGGSFGMKSAPYPEYIAALAAARITGRAVRWRDTRSDSFLSDTHGRDAWAEAAIAFDAEGRLLAGRVTSHANSGAYLGQMGPNAQTGNIKNNFPCVYQLPALYVRTIAAFTNVTPVGAYRGAGRPEAVYYMERAMDLAAREMNIDPVELRRRNLIGQAQMPYKAASGLTYDSGDFATVLDKAIAASDWSGFEARRAESARAGLLRGRGIACYLEVTGPSAKEMGGIRFGEDGTVTMVSGSLDYGQGHLTPFAQVVASRLYIPLDRFRLLQGDVDELIAGSGTGGSRTIIAAGSLLLKAADLVVENGRQLAAHVLEAAADDIEFERGRFRIAGTDREIGVMELACRVRELAAAGAIPDDLPQSLDVATTDDTPPSSFPNGAHVAEVEIDRETGTVKFVRYLVVDDFGTLINPLLVEGQVHGGVVQGAGQVLMENVVYDAAGQLLTGSYMDYAMPRAIDVPDIVFAAHSVPATTNPLGAKGCGEAGCAGALPAVTNAIVDVLAREAGVTHIDLPATPEKVWLLLNGRAAAGGA